MGRFVGNVKLRVVQLDDAPEGYVAVPVSVVLPDGERVVRYLAGYADYEYRASPTGSQAQELLDVEFVGDRRGNFRLFETQDQAAAYLASHVGA